MLDDAADRLDARGARELLDLGQLVVGIRSLGQHREHEPALRLGGAIVESSTLIMPALRAAWTPTLAERTLALVDIPSPSREEASALYATSRRTCRCRRCTTTASRCSTRKRAGKPLVLLAGHTDTVPAQGNLPGRIEDGAVHGLGATDMKGGLAVMIELARWAAETPSSRTTSALLFFPREELGPADNPLPGVFAAAPVVDEAALVICLEPTDNTLQLGCLGNLNARVVFEGRRRTRHGRGTGVNAVELALEGLRAVLELEPRDVEVDGLVFREVLSVTQIHGGDRDQRDPGARRVHAELPLRPDRTPAEAEAARCASSSAATSRSSRTRPRRTSPSDSPLVERLRDVGAFAIEPKQAWTNVADFAARGPRRGQLRARRDALRPRGRRAGRDRRARADLRRAAAVPAR